MNDIKKIVSIGIGVLIVIWYLFIIFEFPYYLGDNIFEIEGVISFFLTISVLLWLIISFAIFIMRFNRILRTDGLEKDKRISLEVLHDHYAKNIKTLLLLSVSYLLLNVINRSYGDQEEKIILIGLFVPILIIINIIVNLVISKTKGINEEESFDFGLLSAIVTLLSLSIIFVNDIKGIVNDLQSIIYYFWAQIINDSSIISDNDTLNMGVILILFAVVYSIITLVKKWDRAKRDFSKLVKSFNRMMTKSKQK